MAKFFQTLPIIPVIKSTPVTSVKPIANPTMPTTATQFQFTLLVSNLCAGLLESQYQKGFITSGGMGMDPFKRDSTTLVTAFSMSNLSVLGDLTNVLQILYK